MSFTVSSPLFIGFEMVNDVRPTQYRKYIIGLLSFLNLIFMARFVIFNVSLLMDGISPTLSR